MVFLVRVGFIVSIIAFVVLVIDMSRAAWRVHVGWVKYNAVDRFVAIWQIAAVRSRRKISWQELKGVIWNFPPKKPLFHT